MKGRTRLLRALVVTALVGGSLAVAQPAHALFHLMKLTEIFAGTTDEPAAQFIEMQMYAENQRFLATHEVVVFDSTGVEKATFTFTGPVDNGENQSYVLLATPEAEELFGVAADLQIDAQLTAGGGKVCFQSSSGDAIDCASWGEYSGDREGTGTPFNAPVGLVPGQSMEREIDGGEDPENLDAEDDTDDSAADFRLASPSPTNNSGNEQGVENHDRSISLRLKKGRRLTASGRVTPEDGFVDCAQEVPVKIQRKARGNWTTLKKTATDADGAYRTKVRKRAGAYRAKAPKTTPSEADRCNPAVSATRRVRRT